MMRRVATHPRLFAGSAYSNALTYVTALSPVPLHKKKLKWKAYRPYSSCEPEQPYKKEREIDFNVPTPHHTPPPYYKQIPRPDFKMVYTIVVHLYAKADAEAISKLKAKLVEASQVYSKDKETLSWFVMQDTKDERAFTIVERYLQESVSFLPLHFNLLFGWTREWLTQFTVPTISSEQPLLEDVWSICHSVVGEAHGFEEIGGAGYKCSG
jgi:hypothetical protein